MNVIKHFERINEKWETLNPKTMKIINQEFMGYYAGFV